MAVGYDDMENGRETRKTGWENGGGPRVLIGVPFCGRRFVIDGTRAVCHSLQGHEDAGMKPHQVIYHGFMLEVDDGGLLA